MDSLTELTESSSADPTRDDPYIGRVLGQQYRIDKRLGQGGMGTVYQGVQLSVNRLVAVKVIAAGSDDAPEVAARFRREAQALAQLRHPNTLRLLDFGVTEQKRLYMVMEWLRGCDLDTHLSQTGTVPLIDALLIVRQIAQSLSEAHARGIVHRDLKPGNVFLSEVEGGDCFVKVMDFGVAGFLHGSEETAITLRGEVLGTAAYMSPEQAQGLEVDGRSDLYSLGVLLFEMLTGRPPFIAKTAVSLLLMQVNDPPPRLLQVAPKLRELTHVQGLVDRLIAKDKEDRLQSAAEVIREVDRLLGTLGHSVSAWVGSVSTVPPERLRPRLWTSVSNVLLPLLCMLTGWLAWQHAQPEAVMRAPAQGSYIFDQLQHLGQLQLLDSAPSDSQSAAPLADVTIASVPAGATVSLSGAELGKTPYRLRLRAQTTVELSLPGYAPARVLVEPQGEPNLIVKLAPLSPYRAGLTP